MAAQNRMNAGKPQPRVRPPLPSYEQPIYKALDRAWSAKQRKNWDCIYILVDVHGVLMEPDYTKPSEKIYTDCIEPLQKMTDDSRFKLIMWTCSRELDIEKYRATFEQLGVVFDYVNRNPEVEHIEALGDYTKKLYANVILDDKAGFEPTHWIDIGEWMHDLEVDEMNHT